MKILIFLLYIITTSLTISYAQSNCVPHQIILLFKNDPTTLYQQALSDPDCLAASTCVDLHPFARTGRYTSDCGETVSALIERFKDHPELELCEPNHYKQTCNTLPIETALPNDPLFKNQWSLHNTRQQPNSIAGADINFIEAQSLLKHLSPTSTPSVVGVIDSGFDISHPDLKNNLWNNPSEIPDNGIDDDGNGYIDDNHGYDFINNSGDLSRTSAEIANHGTHVAGIIAAQTDNSIGISGIAPHTQLILLRISSDGFSIDNDKAIEAYHYLANLKKNHNIPIVAANASYGGYTSYSMIELHAIHQMNLENITLCAAAGNDSLNIDETANNHYPASYPLANIIAIGATTPANQRAFFSNYGTNTISIAAPGENILSTIPRTLIPQLSISNTEFPAFRIHNTQLLPSKPITASLIASGIGQTNDFIPEVAGNIAFIQRGTLTFKNKIIHAANAGARAVIIYNNQPETDVELTHDRWIVEGIAPIIPAIAITYAEAQNILPQIQNVPTVTLASISDPNYEPYASISGTSQATPHITAAIALTAQLNPERFFHFKDDLTEKGYIHIPSLEPYVKNGALFDLTQLLDTDQDHLPDWWERKNTESLAFMNGTADQDNDTWNNRQEYHGNSDPYYSLSIPNAQTSLDSILINSQENKLIQHHFHTIPDLQYTLQFNTQLNGINWNNKTESYAGTGNRATVSTPIDDNSEAGFYRLKIDPPTL